MSAPVVELDRLTKRYGRHPAVDSLSFDVPRACVFGFLGRNGAGKSTTIGMMLRLVRPTAGSIRFFGERLTRSFRPLARRVGALLEQPAFPPHWTGRGNLLALAHASGIRDRHRVDALLAATGLAGAADRKVGAYSQGMRQSLGLAAALLRRPELLVLDEPTNGLDPEAVQRFRALVRRLRDEHGTTIFLSSHLLHEVEMLCDRVAIIRDGRLVVAGAVDDLLDPELSEVEIHVDDPERAIRVLATIPTCGSPHRPRSSNGVVRVAVRKAHAAEVNGRLVREGLAVAAFAPVRRTLEDFFLESTAPASPPPPDEPEADHVR